MDVATCMYYTGLDPYTLTPVPVARKSKARQTQRALLQYFKPENWADVRSALLEAGRQDLIGEGPECLIPSRPPRIPPGSTGRRPPERKGRPRA
jgi:hypothetical protein